MTLLYKVRLVIIIMKLLFTTCHILLSMQEKTLWEHKQPLCMQLLLWECNFCDGLQILTFAIFTVRTHTIVSWLDVVNNHTFISWAVFWTPLADYHYLVLWLFYNQGSENLQLEVIILILSSDNLVFLEVKQW